MPDLSPNPATEDRHVPVLLETCVELIAPAADHAGAVVVDATLGMGGHSEALLRRLPGAVVVGIDRDPQALALASERLAAFGDRFRPVHAVYDEIPEVLDELGLGRADGILMDLGVSSLQIDEADRGFAYSQDAPLDMRMDATQGRTAADVLNTYDERELARILRDYGEERFAPRIARAVVRRREQRPWERSGELVELLRGVIPAATRKTGGNPAKRTFQALRIEVNAELSVLEDALPAAVSALAVGGRLVVMSYHSLEDRLTKHAFAAGTTSTTPPGVPVELAGHEPYLRALVRGALKADEQEVERNPRAASVRLRAVERVRETADRTTGRSSTGRRPAGATSTTQHHAPKGGL